MKMLSAFAFNDGQLFRRSKIILAYLIFPQCVGRIFKTHCYVEYIGSKRDKKKQDQRAQYSVASRM